jgi:hypothetical protein
VGTVPIILDDFSQVLFSVNLRSLRKMKILPVTLLFLLGGFSLSFSQTSRSIKPVETQTAVFIGHTETAIRNGRNVSRQSVLITSWAQYEKYFGGPTSGYYLHESVKLFFENGGKRTYVISVGSTLDPVQKTRLTRGLNVSRQVNAQLVFDPGCSGPGSN